MRVRQRYGERPPILQHRRTGGRPHSRPGAPGATHGDARRSTHRDQTPPAQATGLKPTSPEVPTRTHTILTARQATDPGRHPEPVARRPEASDCSKWRGGVTSAVPVFRPRHPEQQPGDAVRAPVELKAGPGRSRDALPRWRWVEIRLGGAAAAEPVGVAWASTAAGPDPDGPVEACPAAGAAAVSAPGLHGMGGTGAPGPGPAGVGLAPTVRAPSAGCRGRPRQGALVTADSTPAAVEPAAAQEVLAGRAGAPGSPRGV
ncbi:hypothetical protein GCM10010441_47740 [Kitasatospora paracochleata]